MNNYRYSTFALGSSNYPHFCGFGKWLDETLFSLGSERISDLALGDELGDRDKTFKTWVNETYIKACKLSGVPHQSLDAKDVALRWFNPGKVNQVKHLDLIKSSKYKKLKHM